MLATTCNDDMKHLRMAEMVRCIPNHRINNLYDGISLVNNRRNYEHLRAMSSSRLVTMFAMRIALIADLLR